MAIFKRCILFLFLLIGLTKSDSFAQNTLVFQPDSECSEVALIWYLSSQGSAFGLTNSKNFGNIKYLPIQEWTWHGNQGHRWILIDFLNNIDFPKDLEVTAARLSLYAPEKANSDGFHSLYTERRKRSIAVLERILEPWDENMVNWDTRPAASRLNHVVLPEPMSEQEDFIDIDVTGLVQDMLRMPEQSHGFLIRMQDDDYYRKLIFAGSNYDNVALRPRLEIDYAGKPLSFANTTDCDPHHDCTVSFSDDFDLQAPGPAVYRPSISPACPISNYHFRIYDLEGHEVFYTTQPQMGWDGQYRRKQVSDGQYLYFCNYQLPGENQITTHSGVFWLGGEIRP